MPRRNPHCPHCHSDDTTPFENPDSHQIPATFTNVYIAAAITLFCGLLALLISLRIGLPLLLLSLLALTAAWLKRQQQPRQTSVARGSFVCLECGHTFTSGSRLRRRHHPTKKPD